MPKAPTRIKIPVSRGRYIVIDRATGKPKAKQSRVSVSARIAKAKRPKQTWRGAR